MLAEAVGNTGLGLMPYLTVGILLFGIGLIGVMTSRHLIRTLMCVELMLNAVNLNLVAINNHLPMRMTEIDLMGKSLMTLDVSGQIFAIFILTISAAEAAVGLAIVIALFKSTNTVDVESFQQLKL